MEPTKSTETNPSPQLTNDSSSVITSALIFLSAGLLIGAGVAFCYFLFLAPKPEPVVVEKIIEKVVEATTTVAEPVKTYNFHTIDLENISTSTLSQEDATTIEIMKEVIGNDADYIKYSKISPIEFKKVVITPTYNLMIASGGGEGLLISRHYVVDVKNKKILDKFTYSSMTYPVYLDEGFVFGFNSYRYGATSSKAFVGADLPVADFGEGPGPVGEVLTYDAYIYSDQIGGEEMNLDVSATTSDSITYAIFELDKNATPIDSVIYNKKVGERMFILP